MLPCGGRRLGVGVGGVGEGGVGEDVDEPKRFLRAVNGEGKLLNRLLEGVETTSTRSTGDFTGEVVSSDVSAAGGDCGAVIGALEAS